MAEEKEPNFADMLGHQGVGDNCVDKVVNYTPKFFLAGKLAKFKVVLVRIIWSHVCLV